MSDDGHDHDHNHVDPPSFPIQTNSSIIGFLIFFLAYYLSHHTPFAYVENDTAALAAKSARGEPVVWSSFDKHFVQSPKAFLQPSDKAELLEILRQAREENQTVKVVGSGHSWSPLGLTPSYMVSLDKLNRVLEIDAERRRVRVEAGARIRDLSSALAQHDPPLALRNTGVLNRQSLAGALATGTHGTGITFPIMSDALRAVELVTASGETVRAKKDDPEPALQEVFEAAAIHLGALGVVTEMELEVVPAFSVFKRTRLLPLEQVLAQLPQIARESDHVLMWWVPYTDTVQLLESNRTTYGVEPPPPQQCTDGSTADGSSFSSWSVLVAKYLRPLRPLLGRLQVRALSAAGWLSSLLPITTVPFTNRWLVAPALHLFALGGKAGAFVPEGYKAICLDDHPDQYREAEYFLPPSRFPEAFARFRALLEEHKATLGANFVVQLRMTARDDLWLSPFRGNEEWYMSVATLVKGFDAGLLFKLMETEAWLPCGGKPHWGKLHYLGHNELRQLYGEPFERFLAVRRRLDPTDMFLNAHLRDLFLPRASK